MNFLLSRQFDLKGPMTLIYWESDECIYYIFIPRALQLNCFKDMGTAVLFHQAEEYWGGGGGY
jgi:hypothetical protein